MKKLKNANLGNSLESLGWLGIIRLGLVQTALGAMVVITTSTLNRVMVIELALAAVLPGLLVALHYAVQITRPRMGHSSDVGSHRTPWIIGGIVTLAIGSISAALSTALMATNLWAGVAAAALSFALIGLGVGASGTSLLALLASRVDEHRRPAAATVVWVMMIAGFVLTAGIAGSHLDPFSMMRLVVVTAIVAVLAVVLAVLAVWGVEKNTTPQNTALRQSANQKTVSGFDGTRADTTLINQNNDDRLAAHSAQTHSQHTQIKSSFRQALSETWQDDRARQFTVFVFVSMLAYSAQDLILEPYAGAIFGYSPGESTQLAGVQHGGVLLGMIIVAVLGTRLAKKKGGSLRIWCVGGCLASAAALAFLSLGGITGGQFPLKQAVFALGLANGVFAVAAIASMMSLASSKSGEAREGIRMGVWGAAQAMAFALGGFAGTAAIDVARALVPDLGIAYSSVFAMEAILFIIAASLAFNLDRERTRPITLTTSEHL